MEARSEAEEPNAGIGWAWEWRTLASAGLAFHLLAMLAVALAGAPASPLERELAEVFSGYVDLIDQGHVHRYYAPAPPPTPIVTAELQFGEGEPTKTVRLPDRSTWPRLRYQRQLALAHHLNSDFQMSRADPDHGHDHEHLSALGASYARHLCAAHPGCTGVTLRVQQHLAPDLVRLRELGGGTLPDVDDERFYTVPERIGDYPCEGH